jgi:tetratricopeptide (TPR) repeat protein
MKKLILISLLISQAFWGQNAFEKGNTFYQKGKYDEAIIAYESILKSNKQSAELYFNLGNCYYKLNKVAPAIYNFEKALLLKPNDSEIQNNLAFAQKMTIDEITEVPKVGFSRILQDFTSNFHYDTWARITVTLAIAFLCFFLGYYFSNTTTLKRIFFSLMIFTLLFIIISFFAGFFEKSNNEKERPAIVFNEVASVKSEPKSNSQEAFILHAGTKVNVLESLNNFKKIQLLDLKEGWIDKNMIKELK